MPETLLPVFDYFELNYVIGQIEKPSVLSTEGARQAQES